MTGEETKGQAMSFRSEMALGSEGRWVIDCTRRAPDEPNPHDSVVGHEYGMRIVARMSAKGTPLPLDADGVRVVAGALDQFERKTFGEVLEGPAMMRRRKEKG